MTDPSIDLQHASWHNWWKDSALLLLLLGLGNFFFAPEDVGFLTVNPTPLLIVPIAIGLWYGFLPGLIVGTVVLFAILGGRAYFGDHIEAIMLAHSYTLLSLPVAGALCGEIFRSARSRRDHAEFENHHYAERLQKISADADHLREVKNRLERLLLKRDTLVFSFDNEIRALYDTPASSFGAALLQTLNRTERVYNAAFYSVENKQLIREAWTGDVGFFAEKIDGKDDPMVRAVLKNGELSALPEFLTGKPGSTKETSFLACFPMKADGKILGVIAIAGIPFINFERRTLRRIDTFCSWAAQILDQRIESSSNAQRSIEGYPDRMIARPEVLIERVALAVRSYELLQAPFTLLMIQTEENEISQPQLEAVFVTSFRAGDTLCVFREGTPHIILLAPFTGERAEATIDHRLKSAWSKAGHDPKSLKIHYWSNSDLNTETLHSEIAERVQ